VAQGQTPPPPKALADLWIDVSMGPPLVDWFNEAARPDDIARAEHVALMNLMDEITAGQRLVVFKSAADAREALPFIADRIDILGYNLERGPANPAEEQADPIASIQLARSLADQHGLMLAVGPDRIFALQYGGALAPYVDIFVLQIQRVQTEPQTVRDFVLPLAQELRRANPDIQISVQVRTEGDVEQLADLLESLLPAIDGVSILTSPETVDIAEDLVRELRSRTAPPAVPTATRISSTTGETVPRALAAELATPVVTPVLLPTAVMPSPQATAPAAAEAPTISAEEEDSPQPLPAEETSQAASEPEIYPGVFRRALLPLAGLLAAAAIVGGVVGALVVLVTRHKS
jgi:hypothetical protein